MGLEFESDRIQSEWASPALNPKLMMVVSDLARYAMYRWDTNLTITCLLRTPSENDALYGNDGSHLTGPHVIGNAADIRTHDLPQEVPVMLSGYLNRSYLYDPRRQWLHVGLLEDCKDPGSTAPHLHVQVTDDTQIVSIIADGQAATT